jgi:hypothetical protein
MGELTRPNGSRRRAFPRRPVHHPVDSSPPVRRLLEVADHHEGGKHGRHAFAAWPRQRQFGQGSYEPGRLHRRRSITTTRDTNLIGALHTKRRARSSLAGAHPWPDSIRSVDSALRSRRTAARPHSGRACSPRQRVAPTQFRRSPLHTLARRHHRHTEYRPR